MRARGAQSRGEGGVPRVQAGSGDTPGPNHPTDIGRTWTAAQLVAGGAGIVAVDVRSPAEWAQAHLPGAVLLPAAIAAEALAHLPGGGTDTCLAVYDAVGGSEAANVAALLRERGWPRARRLVGGFAEWVEEGEDVVAASDGELPFRIGATVRIADGRTGVVWRVPRNAEPAYGVLVTSTDGARSVDCVAGELAT